MKELLLFLSIVVGGLILVIGSVVMLESYQCDNYSKITGKKTKYSALTCYVQTSKGMIPYDEMKARSVTNE